MLHTLPTEVLLGVIHRICNRDILSLRLVSHHLDRIVIAMCGPAIFGNIMTDMTEADIHRLEMIAATETYRHHVHTLQVYSSARGKTIDFFDGEIMARLDSIWSSFSNLLKLEIRHRYLGFRVGGEMQHFTSHDYIQLALSVSTGDAAKLRVLSLDLDVDSSKNTRLSNEKLALSLQSKSLSIEELDFRRRISGDDDATTAVNLIQACPNLKRLRISIESSSREIDIISLISNAPNLPPLQSLVIQTHDLYWTTSMDLVQTTLRFRNSIQEISIHDVLLKDGVYSSVFAELCQYEFPNLQRICFSSIGETFKTLTYWSVVLFCNIRLNQQLMERCEGKFEFQMTEFGGYQRVNGLRYTGSPDGMKQLLDYLAQPDAVYALPYSDDDVEDIRPKSPHIETFTDKLGIVMEDLTEWK